MPEETDEALKKLAEDILIVRRTIELGEIALAWNNLRKIKHECERIEEELHDFMLEERIKEGRLPIRDDWRQG